MVPRIEQRGDSILKMGAIPFLFLDMYVLKSVSNISYIFIFLFKNLHPIKRSCIFAPCEKHSHRAFSHYHKQKSGKLM